MQAVLKHDPSAALWGGRLSLYGERLSTILLGKGIWVERASALGKVQRRCYVDA